MVEPRDHGPDVPRLGDRVVRDPGPAFLVEAPARVAVSHEVKRTAEALGVDLARDQRGGTLSQGQERCQLTESQSGPR